MLPMVIGQLPVLFAAEERAKAIAAVMAATMVGYPIGPILGGWLLTNYWWGSVFLINVPVVVLALIAVVAWLPESRSCRAATVRSRRHRHLERRPCRAPLRGDPGRAVRLGRGQRGRRLHRRRVRAGGFRALGAARRATRWSTSRLFRSASFTWGTLLMTTVSFAMFGRAVRRAAVLPGDPGQGRLRQRPAAAAHGRRACWSAPVWPPLGQARRRQGRLWASASGCWPAGLLAGATHERDQRPGLDDHVDRCVRLRLGLRHANGHGRGLERALAGAQRRGLGAAAGGAHGRRLVRRGHPGLGAQRRLSRPARPDGLPICGRRLGEGERVRRRRRGPQARFGGAAASRRAPPSCTAWT